MGLVLPAAWTNMPGLILTGTFTLQTSGCNNTNPHGDQHGFIKYELCGNGSISFRVASVSSPQVFAGILLRANLDPGSTKADMSTNRVATPNNHRASVRTTPNGAAHAFPFSLANQTFYRLERQGNRVTISTSANGQQWTVRLLRDLTLPLCVNIGLFSYGTGTATFDNVSVTGGSPLQTSPEGGGFLSLEDSFKPSTVSRLPFTVYPNPTAGQLTVEIPAELSLEGATLDVFDSYGRRLLRETRLDYRHQLDLSRLPAGAYLLSLQTADGEPWVERVVVN